MLDEQSLLSAVELLAAKDPTLREIIKKYGPPPLWSRNPTFSTLIKIILEQQVSLASAQATYNKLTNTVNPLNPKTFNTITDRELRNMGFSRQKAKYCRILSEAILDGDIILDEIMEKSVDDAMKILTALKGIGPWTASIYLLMALKRPDIWPEGDRALLISMKESMNLTNVPTPTEAVLIAEFWKPWRSVAARILWHSYLSERKKK
jgi:DNA-3-methyladenine glycosylase II